MLNYEDLPQELRAMIFQLRTPLRKEFLKEKATIIFRNIKRFVLIKRAFDLCYRLYDRELVECEWGSLMGSLGTHSTVTCANELRVYQKKNMVFTLDYVSYRDMEDVFPIYNSDFSFNYQGFLHSICFPQFASNCHPSFVTDSRNLKIDIQGIVGYHEPMLGFSVSKVNLDDFKPFGNLPLDSDNDSDAEDSDAEDSDSEDESGPESDAEDSNSSLDDSDPE